MSVPPIVRHVVVSATPEVAYATWTGEIGSWWPLGRFSIYDADNSVAFIGDEIVERSSTGEASTWGTVVTADPPRRLTFTWHPGRSPEAASTVAVDFVPVGEGRTLVRLTHTGWEAFADPVSGREEYRNGWPIVIAGYAAGVPTTEPADQYVWLILGHSPGEAAEGSVSTHPLFQEHRAFLARLADDDVLVAAGPLPDSPGHGQTIIRVPASTVARRVQEAHDDPAVAGDVLVLTVRPWNVVTHASSTGVMTRTTTDTRGATPGRTWDDAASVVRAAIYEEE